MHVLLFDIDGTLIRSGGAGKAAMEEALRTEFGVRDIVDGVPFSGRTDPAISRDLLHLHGVDPSPANVERLGNAYLRVLPDSLRSIQGVILPGVIDLLKTLSDKSQVALGLLTGNVREGARCKLTHYDLWHYFPFGAFADGRHERDDIARHALVESKRHLGHDVPGTNVWVIGDTPHDVQCARAIGARAVAVATGWHSLDELHSSRADFVLSDLTSPASLLQLWGLGFSEPRD